MKKKHSALFILAVAAVLTGAYLLGISFNLTPWLRGPQEWRWPYVLPIEVWRNWLPLLLCLVYLGFIYWWDKQDLSRRRIILALVVAAMMTPALQLALLYLDHDDVRSQLFLRTASDLSGGFYNVGAAVTEPAEFLTHFAVRMSDYPIHPQRHPPGLPLLFALARQFFDQVPGVTSAISGWLRPYQCHNLDLMYFSDSAIAAATVQMAVPLALGLVAWAIYFLGREVYGRKTAARAALLWPLLPSVALWATRWNQLYALFTVLAFLFFHWGLSRRKLWLMLLSGFIVSLASFFSFGNVVIVGFLGLYALVWLAAGEKRLSWTWLIGGATLFFLGMSLVWLAVWPAYGLRLDEVWNRAMGTHLSIGRSYWTWLIFHLYDFFVFLGIPLFVFWLAQTVRAARQWQGGPKDVLAVSFVVALLLFNLSGLSQGEVARVWAFLLPLPLLIAVRFVPRNGWVFSGLAGLVMVQVLVSNTFLQPVSTGLLDPLAPPPVAAVDSAEPLAVWQEGLTLREAVVPELAVAGRPITVDLVWDSEGPTNQPYTLFVHLVDEQGQLVAQWDGMPLNGEWLTTCWVGERPFADQISLLPPADLPPGEYRVQTGFYYWPTGERLPLVAPEGRLERNVEVGIVVLD